MIYSADTFNVVLNQTEEQRKKGETATSLEELGDPLLVDGSVSIDEFMQKLGPQEADRMAAEYARKAGIEKPKVNHWSFWGFEPTELTEMPTERDSDVRRE